MTATSAPTKIAVAQLRSGPDVEANLARITALTAQAATAGADLVAFPEYAAYLGDNSRFAEFAEPITTGPIVGAVREAARAHRIAVLLGSTVEDGGDGRTYNTSVLIDEDGSILASYRKLHLFTSSLPGAAGGEGNFITRGDEVVVVSWRGWSLGMSICFDVRFPELYRALAARSADVMLIPAAFVAVTGRDHWDVLLRARAIENQAYVIAPAQIGPYDGGETYGRSCIVDPWGTVLATVGDGAGDGLAIAELSRARLDEVRTHLPALAQRRPELAPCSVAKQ